MKLNKIICMLLLVCLFGCMDNINKTSPQEKDRLTKSWILNNSEDSKTKVKNIMNYLKEQSNKEDAKIREQANNELKEWKIYIDIYETKKELIEIEKEEAKKQKEKKFIEEFCYYFIEDDLKDPDSYKLDYVIYKNYGDLYKITHSYRAKNSFGGYVKDSQSYEVVLEEEDFKREPRFVASNKKYKMLMDEWKRITGKN